MENMAQHFLTKLLLLVSIRKLRAFNKNDIVVPFELDDVGFFMGEMLIVEKNGKSGVCDLRGKLLIPCEYDHIDYCNDWSDNLQL